MIETGAKEKSRQAGLSKVRTGCITCKSRRVKCDEAKPSCQRCIKFGVVCGGYKPLKPSRARTTSTTPVSSQPRALLPSTAISKSQISPIEIIEKLFETQQEHDYFVTFCTKTVFDILPSFQSQLLQQTLLQACASLPSIRSAVVALGALDRTSASLATLSPLSLDDEEKQWADHHHRNALKQYSKAVQRMRAETVSGNPELRVTLLTCLVIMCFEAWNGNHQNAVSQISLAFKLIKAWKGDSNSEPGTSASQAQSTNEVEDDLILAFSRLDVQVISLAEEQVKGYSAFSTTEEAVLLDAMPPVFGTVPETERYENVLVRRAMRFLTSDVPLGKPSPTVHAFPLNGWWGVKDPTVVAKQQQNIAYYTRWFLAVDPLWNKLGLQRFTDWWAWRRIIQEKPTVRTLGQFSAMKRAPTVNEKCEDFEQLAMFRVHLFAAWLALVTVCTSNEADFDAYDAIFAEMLELIECLLEPERALTERTAPKFSFDSFVVIPLHMVGHKCRNPMLRRRAVTILHRYPRREGVWDSLLIVRIIEWVMGVEEERMQQGQVPDWARLHGVQIKRDLEKKTALLTCEQRVSAASTEVMERVKIIVW